MTQETQLNDDHVASPDATKEPRARRKGAVAAFWCDDVKEFARHASIPRQITTSWDQLFIYQVNYGKLLEMDLFFLRHNIWGFAKLQDLGNKKSQTVEVALSVMLQAISIYYIFCSGILAKPTKHWCYVASVGFQLGLANFNSIKIK
jgi:hypothetical protein